MYCPWLGKRHLVKDTDAGLCKLVKKRLYLYIGDLGLHHISGKLQQLARDRRLVVIDLLQAHLRKIPRLLRTRD